MWYISSIWSSLKSRRRCRSRHALSAAPCPAGRPKRLVQTVYVEAVISDLLSLSHDTVYSRVNFSSRASNKPSSSSAFLRIEENRGSPVHTARTKATYCTLGPQVSYYSMNPVSVFARLFVSERSGCALIVSFKALMPELSHRASNFETAVAGGSHLPRRSRMRSWRIS